MQCISAFLWCWVLSGAAEVYLHDIWPSPTLYLTYLLWLWTVWWHLSLFAVEGEQRHLFSLFLKWLSFDKVTGSSSCVCGEHDQPDMYSLWQLVLFKVRLIQTFPFGCQRTTSSEDFFCIVVPFCHSCPCSCLTPLCFCSGYIHSAGKSGPNWIFWGPYATF